MHRCFVLLFSELIAALIQMNASSGDLARRLDIHRASILLGNVSLDRPATVLYVLQVRAAKLHPVLLLSFLASLVHHLLFVFRRSDRDQIDQLVGNVGVVFAGKDQVSLTHRRAGGFAIAHDDPCLELWNLVGARVRIAFLSLDVSGLFCSLSHS